SAMSGLNSRALAFKNRSLFSEDGGTADRPRGVVAFDRIREAEPRGIIAEQPAAQVDRATGVAAAGRIAACHACAERSGESELRAGAQLAGRRIGRAARGGKADPGASDRDRGVDPDPGRLAGPEPDRGRAGELSGRHAATR